MRARLLAGILLLAAPLAVRADEPQPKFDYAAERAAIARYQDADQRLQDVGWQLASANAPFCQKVTPSIGLQLQDMASYGAPAVARAVLGLKRDFAVQTAARGSPAALTGAFARNREVTRLVALDPNSLPAGGRFDWQRLKQVHDHAEDLLKARGNVTITFADADKVLVESVPVCATRFELMGDGDKAVADGERVVIGMGFPAFAYQEEAVFAGLVAHELAHNVLGHDAWLDRNGRKGKHVRVIEREADRLIPWLLANAGYDPEAGVTFMTRWGSQHDSGLKYRRKHEGWDERAEAIAAEVRLVRELLEREGKADWATYFRREIDPAGGLVRAPRR